MVAFNKATLFALPLLLQAGLGAASPAPIMGDALARGGGLQQRDDESEPMWYKLLTAGIDIHIDAGPIAEKALEVIAGAVSIGKATGECDPNWDIVRCGPGLKGLEPGGDKAEWDVCQKNDGKDADFKGTHVWKNIERNCGRHKVNEDKQGGQ